MVNGPDFKVGKTDIIDRQGNRVVTETTNQTLDGKSIWTVKEYNDKGQLTSEKIYQDNNSHPALTTTYTYNENGTRKTQIDTWDFNSNGILDENDSQRITEYDENGKAVSATTINADNSVRVISAAGYKEEHPQMGI